VDLVLVPVAVSDAMNRPVIDLDQQNFALYQGDEQREMRSVSAEDASTSVGCSTSS
jgi:hypothetical protein